MSVVVVALLSVVDLVPDLHTPILGLKLDPNSKENPSFLSLLLDLGSHNCPFHQPIAIFWRPWEYYYNYYYYYYNK
jgi:hypothetical protein